MLDVFALFPVLFVLVFIIIIISVAINFYRIIRGRPIQAVGEQPVGVIKEREIIREIVKIRCPYCNNLYDETYDKCPYCGGKR